MHYTAGETCLALNLCKDGEMQKYDFNCCKLCGENTAEPAYNLAGAIVYCCRSCDFHFLDHLDPEPEIETENKKLDESAWKYIEARRDESAALLPKRLELACKHIALRETQFLDIGAGIGQFQMLLSEKGAVVRGIEPSAIRREYARQKYGISLQKELAGEDYWQSSYRGYFDVVSLWDVIEHVNFPLETLQAASELLKPGGFLFLDTPSRATMSYRLSERAYKLSRGKIPLFLPSFYSTAPYGHKQIFKTAQLIHLLKGLGLELLTIKDSYSAGIMKGDKIILACRKPERANDQKRCLVNTHKEQQ